MKESKCKVLSTLTLAPLALRSVISGHSLQLHNHRFDRLVILKMSFHLTVLTHRNLFLRFCKVQLALHRVLLLLS